MEKKQEILEAAFEIFCEKGYHLSVAELAAAVKIKTPSLYSHFESKDEIIELIVQSEIQRYYDSLTKTMLEIEVLSCKEAMKQLFDFVIDYFCTGKRLRFWRAIPFIPNQRLNCLFAQAISEKDAVFIQKMQRCFLKGQSNAEIRSDASLGSLRLYLCMIQGVLDGILLYPKELGGKNNTTELFEAYWYGICSADTDEARLPNRHQSFMKEQMK